MKNNSELNLIQPKSINELDSELVNKSEKYEFVAGSTDLLVQNTKWETYYKLVDLSLIKEMTETLIVDDNYLTIGATVPMTNIINSVEVQKMFPILIKSCSLIGSIQIQNRATLGGNIGNASPAGDTLPVLVSLDAELLIGPKTETNDFKVVKLSDFYLGFKKSILKNNEYIAFVRIPITKVNPSNWYFRKVGQRYSMAISKVSMALLIWMKDDRIEDIRISTGSVNAVIKREINTEKLLINNKLTNELILKAVEEIKKEINPISDIRSNIVYRKHTAGELLKEALSLIINS